MTVGLMCFNGYVYAKMTREDCDYQVSSSDGYTYTGVYLNYRYTYQPYMTTARYSEYGVIFTNSPRGSSSTYYCDTYGVYTDLPIMCLFFGGRIYDAVGDIGMFSAVFVTKDYEPHVHVGCGLSCEQPAPLTEE